VVPRMHRIRTVLAAAAVVLSHQQVARRVFVWAALQAAGPLLRRPRRLHSVAGARSRRRERLA
jgi:hypothetical protein